MKLEEARELIKNTFEKYAEKFREYGVDARIEFSYDTSNFSPCTENDKRLAMMSADLVVKTKSMRPNEAIYYGVVVDAKRQTVKEEKLIEELTVTENILKEILEEIAASDDVDMLLQNEFLRLSADNKAAMEEFNKKMKSMETVAKIATIVGIAIVFAVVILGFVV